MRLYTVQSLEAYHELVNTGRYVCDEAKSRFIIEWAGFKEAYKWIAEQMTKRIGPPPDGVLYPVWAWPTAVSFASRGLRPDQVMIEFEVSRDRVLLSDFEGWHAVIDNYFFAESFDEYDYFKELEPDEKEIAKVDSWEKIFDRRPIDECQATVWELRLGDIRSVTFSDEL